VRPVKSMLRGALKGAVAAIAMFGAAGCGRSEPPAAPAPPQAAAACPRNDSGLTVPDGFCATVFADGIGHARHLAVASNGVVYVNTWSGRYYGEDPLPPGGFLVALQDTKGAGKADVVRRFGDTADAGGTGGTGLAIFDGKLYAEAGDRIVRYTLDDGSPVPQGAPEVVISGLTTSGEHPMHPFAIAADGKLYVDVASATNTCQKKNRELESAGREPCKELESRGGVWQYDANRTGQAFSPAERFATGIRNAGSIAVDAAGRVFATQHGRDQLAENWPKLYTPEQGATQPAEELLQLEKGANFGWPHCYFDSGQGKRVLAPEYGGDGGKSVGLCAKRRAPVAAYPAHWAPTGLAFYEGAQFPARYRGGAFIAFHGSWNRAPFQQDGYKVVFQPFADARAEPGCEIFADGFAGSVRSPEGAAHRPTGLAVAPDGALYISDDVKGRIYRVTYAGAVGASGEQPRVACPNPAAPPVVEPPISEDLSGLAPPQGYDKDTVLLGSRLYHAESGTAACAGCHGAQATGTALGPDLVDAEWLWSDGSVKGIAKTIRDGVPEPRKHRNPMPAMGGAPMTVEQVTAIAAYLRALSDAR